LHPWTLLLLSRLCFFVKEDGFDEKYSWFSKENSKEKVEGSSPNWWEITDNMEVKHKSLKIWILYWGSFALLKRKTSCPILFFIFDRLNSINYPNAVIHWLHWFFNVSWYTTLLYTVLALICGILYIYSCWKTQT
jgi:hypothetical protein